MLARSSSATLPILWPALVFLVQASESSFGVKDPAGQTSAAALALVSYTGILIVMSWLLFPIVWEE